MKINLYLYTLNYFNMKINKRTETLGLHHWSENDLIVNYYVTVYGCNDLYHNTIESICNRLGVSEHSFDYQGRNFRHLMNKPTKTLSDYSKSQYEVYTFLKDENRFEIKEMVMDILDEVNVQRRDLLKQLGKNPDKMRLVTK